MTKDRLGTEEIGEPLSEKGAKFLKRLNDKTGLQLGTNSFPTVQRVLGEIVDLHYITERSRKNYLKVLAQVLQGKKEEYELPRTHGIEINLSGNYLLFLQHRLEGQSLKQIAQDSGLTRDKITKVQSTIFWRIRNFAQFAERNDKDGLVRLGTRNYDAKKRLGTVILLTYLSFDFKLAAEIRDKVKELGNKTIVG